MQDDIKQALGDIDYYLKDFMPFDRKIIATAGNIIFEMCAVFIFLIYSWFSICMSVFIRK